MASGSIAGVNVKIGADLSELKKQLGTVGDTVEKELEPASESVHDLRDSFKETAKETLNSSTNIQEIAKALQTIGTALLGFTKGAIEDALKVNPDVAAQYESISGAFTDLKVALGEGLLSSLEGIAPTVIDVLDSITTFAKENPDTAGLILEIVGGVGLLGSAAVTAAPLLTLFNISLAPISGTVLAVAGAIVGLVVILGLLSASLDEIGDKASNTAEQIATMDTTTQKIVENGIGELEVVDKEIHFVPVWDEEAGDFIEQSAVWDENARNPLTGAVEGYWVPVVVEASEAATEVSEAMASATESMDTTKSLGDQALEVYNQMQESAEGLNEIMSGEGGINEALQMQKEIYESESFKEMSRQPVSEEVTTSWSTFGAGIQSASDGYNDLKTTLDTGGISGAISATGDAASGAAAAFYNLAAAIYGAIDAYLALIRVKNGGGGGGKTNGPTDMLRASGGPVYAGSTYIVGEMGPELFTPSTNGYIVPNDKLGGNGPQVVVNFNGDVIGNEQSIYSLVNRAVKAGIRSEVRAAA